MPRFPSVCLIAILSISHSQASIQGDLAWLRVLPIVYPLVSKGELAPFQELRRTMGYFDVIRICGKPDRDIGSGIYIPVYKLSNGACMVIGCSNREVYSVRYRIDPWSPRP